VSPPRAGAIRFDRNELAGAFGDLGTDLPLVVGIAIAARLDGTSVLVMFGLMQIMAGLVYRMPMPVQPLKAMAAIVIASKVTANVLFGASIAIGAVMLGLSLTGLIDWLARVVPRVVVRGLQFGLGLQLAMLALREYVASDGWRGFFLAAAAFALGIKFLGNRRIPAALILVVLGVGWSLCFGLGFARLVDGVGFALPKFEIPTWAAITEGFVLLALPQIPLSLGNAILATKQTAADLFQRDISVRRISFTYAVMNLASPLFGGIPTCHGSGGMAGHHAFGGRTGGAVIIEGLMYVFLGLVFGAGFDALIGVFPRPLLGVILFFEGFALLRLVGDASARGEELAIVLLTGLIAVTLPYGYLVGMLMGIFVYLLVQRKWLRLTH
jgi:hypothetical protein